MKQTTTPEAPPRPSAGEISALLHAELSKGARIRYTMLLLVTLGLTAALVSLWVTEPPLPLRTNVGFGAITFIALVWACYFVWMLARRKVLLARDAVMAARLAVTFTSAYTLGALLLALVYDDLRRTALLASLLGAFMVAVAVLLLLRARARVAALLTRMHALQGETGSSRRASAILLCVFALASAASSLSAQVITPTPLEVLVLASPAAVRSLGRNHLVYELHVTNLGTTTFRLNELSTMSATQEHPLGTWRDEQLAARSMRAGSVPGTAAEVLTMAPGSRVVIYVWITQPVDAPLPPQITHRVSGTGPDGISHSLTTSAVVVKNDPPAVLTLPVPAGRWVVVRGPSNTSGHRRSIVTLDGATRVPQRFAVDFVMLGNDGRFFAGDGSRNEDWYAYDTPVSAAVAGRVVDVLDGIPDAAPRAAGAATFDRENVTGNRVIVAHDDGQFAVYAHLRFGSISVKTNDRVAAGQVLGRIGNSGHSLAPHLHFHVSDAADPLASEGMPFVFDQYRLIGRLDSVPAALEGKAWTPAADRPARRINAEIPMENMVIEVE